MNSLTPDGDALIDKLIADHDSHILDRAWRPIKTAPKDGRNIILGCPTYVDAGYWDAGGWVLYPDDTSPETNYCQFFHPAPTHWMPLPEPPKTGTKLTQKLKYAILSNIYAKLSVGRGSPRSM